MQRLNAMAKIDSILDIFVTQFDVRVVRIESLTELRK